MSARRLIPLALAAIVPAAAAPACAFFDANANVGSELEGGCGAAWGADAWCEAGWKDAWHDGWHEAWADGSHDAWHEPWRDAKHDAGE